MKVGARVLAGVAFVLSAVACTGAPAPAGSTTLPTAQARPGVLDGILEFPPVDPGVALSHRVSPDPPSPSGTSKPPPSAGTFTLVSCRWQWPGRVAYDVEWDAPADVALPHSHRLRVLHVVSDMGTGFDLDVILAAGGRFTVVVTDGELAAAAIDSPSRRFSVADREPGQSCHLEDAARPRAPAFSSVELRRDGVRPRVHAPDATVEHLLTRYDPNDAEAPLGPLVPFLADSDRPDMSRLYIAPDRRMLSLGARLAGTCLSVTSTYESEAAPDPSDPGRADGRAAVTVTQRRGCPAESPQEGLLGGDGFDTVIGIEDPEWEVRVSGPGGESGRLIEQLQVRLFAP